MSINKETCLPYVIPEGNTQYECATFKPGEIVDAKYIESSVLEERGNRFIEALPLPRIETKDWLPVYTKGLPGFNSDNIGKSTIEKLKEIWLLRTIRFPLPFCRELELEFYRAMTESYRSRYFNKKSYAKYPITIDDTNEYQCGKMAGKKDGSVVGFSLIGLSQTGKTSAIKILTEHYPSVILHIFEDGSYFHQITYLNIECPVHSSIHSMYAALGHEIDILLNNIEVPVYEKMLSKGKSISEKERIFANIVNKLGIGVLILEEVQNMNFQSTDERSFESFLTLCNETQIALVVVGTEDARLKMFGKVERTAHRVGPEIKSDWYCKEKVFLRELIVQLLEYQWFDKKLVATTDIADKLIQVSHGIIGLLIRIYMYMNIEYVLAKKKPVLNTNFIDAVVKKHFEGICSLLDRHNVNVDMQEEYQKKLKQIEQKMEDTINEEEQKKSAQCIVNNTDELITESKRKSFLTERVLDYTDDYSREQIEGFIDVETAKGTFKGMDNKSSLRLFLKILQTKSQLPPETIPVKEEQKRDDWLAEINHHAPEHPFSESGS